MNKDYLTSPLNDDFLEHYKEFQSNVMRTYETVSEMNFSHRNQELIVKAFRDHPLTNYNQNLILAAQRNHVGNFERMSRFYNKEMLGELTKKAMKQHAAVYGIPIKIFNEVDKNNIKELLNKYLLEMIDIEKQFISSNQKVEKKNLPSDTERKVDINIEPQQIQALQYAFFDFVIACKLYKESLNHTVSYSFDRVLSNFGLSSALSSLVALIEPTNPIFSIATFLIMGMIQEIFKEK